MSQQLKSQVGQRTGQAAEARAEDGNRYDAPS